jgi:hypothetical protein
MKLLSLKGKLKNGAEQALIQKDWNEISLLAQRKTSYSPS